MAYHDDDWWYHERRLLESKIRCEEAERRRIEGNRKKRERESLFLWILCFGSLLFACILGIVCTALVREDQHDYNWQSYACSNAPRPEPTGAAVGYENELAIVQARAPEVVRSELALSIEANAARNYHPYYGSWTLVELTPRTVGLVVELSASLNSFTPEQYIASLSSARRQFAGDGMRIYYAQVRAGSIIPPYIVLQNQRGEQGRLVEATPSLRNRGSSGDAHGILMLEDNVRPEDATYTVSFLSLLDNGWGSGPDMPGSVRQEFTFDATDGRLFQILGGMVHTPELVYVEPSHGYDSNHDGFNFGDALGFIGTVVEIIGLFLG